MGNKATELKGNDITAIRSGKLLLRDKGQYPIHRDDR